MLKTKGPRTKYRLRPSDTRTKPRWRFRFGLTKFSDKTRADETDNIMRSPGGAEGGWGLEVEPTYGWPRFPGVGPGRAGVGPGRRPARTRFAPSARRRLRCARVKLHQHRRYIRFSYSRAAAEPTTHYVPFGRSRKGKRNNIQSDSWTRTSPRFRTYRADCRCFVDIFSPLRRLRGRGCFPGLPIWISNITSCCWFRCTGYLSTIDYRFVDRTRLPISP